MPLINPVFGLPFSAVDKVAEKEGKKPKKDQQKKKGNASSQNEFTVVSDSFSSSESEALFPLSQPLDTQTMLS